MIKKLWHLSFAPEWTGPHELIVYAKRTNDRESSSKSVVKFNLDATKLRRPMKFSMIYTQFQTKKCQIYTPMDGILKKDSVVPIHRGRAKVQRWGGGGCMGECRKISQRLI
jgi:hypothetical protein